MPSPLVLINSASQIGGVNVTATTTVTIALASNAGVANWNVTCVGTDELNTIAGIVLTVNHSNNTATFTAPALGSALIFQTQVNNGVDINGVVQPSYTTTFGVYVLTTNGYRVGAQGETTEGNQIYGWLTKLNPLIRNE